MWSIHGPDGTVPTGWMLMPLRLFLGGTFLFAGLQKLANPQFFKSSSLFGIHAQLASAAHSSPIHALLTHLVSVASTIGVVIAIGEVAIGTGILVGLLVRVAAVAGMALSLGLFLTVSFHSSPYFTGSDIVFFFAWTPLALAGAAGAPALDTWLAERRALAPLDSAPSDGVPGTGDPAGDDGLPRRAVLSRGALAGITAGVVVVASGAAAALGRAVGGTDGSVSAAPVPLPATSTTTSPTSTSTSGNGTGESTTSTTEGAPAGTSSVGTTAGVPVGGSAAFTDPATGDPALVIQQNAGEFLAFDAICPHQGCTVAYAPSAKLIACPCHGSEFNARTGAVIRGPATYGLTPIKVITGANGHLYVPK
jgi:thiosulfate dehydrogenase [quinone] large subunit